jgi:polyhydroxybutyrate depolymerase
MTHQPLIRTLAIALAFGSAGVQARAGCADDPAPCTLDGGSYHVVLPAAAQAAPPAVVFLHGYQASGAGMLRMTGMVEALTNRGYAVVAPDGQPMEGSNGFSWDFHPDRPASRNEVAFIAAVADDAAARFGLDRDQMLLAGFSIGGSMTSYLACATPDAFRAYAPVGGSFWRPHPDGCAGPVSLMHMHGWSDQTVPLEGRQIGDDFVQGDVFQAMEIWRITNGCRLQPDSFSEWSNGWTRSWTSCANGGRLDLTLHPGGHSIPPGWSDLAASWFEALP